MAERILPENLSGREIRIAVAEQIAAQLARDGYLNEAHSYSHFTLKGTVHIECFDLGTAYQVNMPISAAPVTDPENAALDAFDAELNEEAQDPNTVREETGQPLHALTKDADGTRNQAYLRDVQDIVIGASAVKSKTKKSKTEAQKVEDALSIAATLTGIELATA